MNDLSNLQIPVFDMEAFKVYALKAKLTGKFDFSTSDSIIYLKGEDTLIFIAGDDFIQLSLMQYNTKQYLILNTSKSKLQVISKNKESVANKLIVNSISNHDYLVFTADEDIYLEGGFSAGFELTFQGETYHCCVSNNLALTGGTIDYIVATLNHKLCLVKVDKNGIALIDFKEIFLVTKGKIRGYFYG